MKRMMVGRALFIVLILGSGWVKASQSVDLDGIRHTCTNRCVVVTKGVGSFFVRDCCGGRVKVTFVATRRR